MFRRIKALFWLRNQVIMSNKNILVQLLMPYFLLALYKVVFNMGKSKSLILVYFCLAIGIAMSVGTTISVVISEEKEKNNLKTLLLSGVHVSDYLISVLIHPILVTVINMVLFPIIADADISEIYIEYVVVIMFTSLAVILINLCIGAVSSTQSKAQINGLPIMFLISLGPMVAQANHKAADFMSYTFLGAYIDLFTKGEFKLQDQSFIILIIWNVMLLICTIFVLRFNMIPGKIKSIFNAKRINS